MDSNMTKGLFHKSFMSFASTDHPDLTRRQACDFGSMVMSLNLGEVVNVTEVLQHWGTGVTVWYTAEKEVE